MNHSNLIQIGKALYSSRDVDVIRTIYENGTVTIAELTGKFNFGQPNSTRIVNKLELAGLVTKDRRGREVLITIAPEHSDFVANFIATERADMIGQFISVEKNIAFLQTIYSRGTMLAVDFYDRMEQPEVTRLLNILSVVGLVSVTKHERRSVIAYNQKFEWFYQWAFGQRKPVPTLDPATDAA